MSSSFGLNAVNREALNKASAPTLHTGWKVDFDRMENPFKTWSGNSNKDASPPRLTAETFQSPIRSASGKLPALSLAVTASPKVGPATPSPRRAVVGTSAREEEVDANDRVLLQLNYRSMEEKCLLSSHPDDEKRYDVYKEAYADVLYRYGAMNLRIEVLKKKTPSVQDARGIAMGMICGSCNEVRTTNIAFVVSVGCVGYVCGLPRLDTSSFLVVFPMLTFRCACGRVHWV